jgi:hypothetical protein
MKQIFIWSFISFFTGPLSLKAQWQVLVNDSFQTTSSFRDLSRYTIWGTNSQPTSAFSSEQKSDRVGFSLKSIFPSDSALKYGGGYTATNSLKTCTAIDYPLFLGPRDNDTLDIEFDAFWDTLSGIGEIGRMVLVLISDYPTGEIPMGLVDSVSLPAPFGRPAYNVRILNRSPSAGTGGNTAPGYLFYGGGMDPLGEFEKTSQWWLPGFIAQPGGTSPQTGPAYPRGGTTRISNLMADQTHWIHFRFRLLPESIRISTRKTAEFSAPETLATEMAIPKTSPGIPYAIAQLNQFYNLQISQLPLNYKWYSKIDAVRFYLRSAQKAYLSNVRISWSGITTQNIPAVAGKSGPLPYPNPVRNNGFFLRAAVGSTYEIQDLRGQILQSGFCPESSWIDMPHYPNGFYFLHVTEPGKSRSIHRIQIQP